MAEVMYYYWEIWIDHSRDLGNGHVKEAGYFVYYKTNLDVEPERIPTMAVQDGHLIDCDLDRVAYALEITPEEYLEKMWD